MTLRLEPREADARPAVVDALADGEGRQAAFPARSSSAAGSSLPSTHARGGSRRTRSLLPDAVNTAGFAVVAAARRSRSPCAGRAHPTICDAIVRFQISS